ncbi:MAG TPA: NADH-quinone oxidoreductase subunit J [Opitutaceae bacterium]|nr:NADH-quinone oxidoreductase subunit J [Opitutaceae bacterium]
MNFLLVIIALLILASAAVAMSLRNLIHSALLLVGNWIGVAAFYLWAGAEFVAFAQVLIYVGAVSMVVLFAMLLTRRGRADAAISPDAARRAVSALAVSGAVAAVLVFAVKHTPLPAIPAPAPSVTVRQLGEQLMGPQAAALVLVGVILTVALLGAVILAATDRNSSEDDVP